MATPANPTPRIVSTLVGRLVGRQWALLTAAQSHSGCRGGVLLAQKREEGKVHVELIEEALARVVTCVTCGDSQEG